MARTITGKYLITSRSGAGKSAICQELLKRGLPAFDGDSVVGLAGWIERSSGQPIKIDYSMPVIDPAVYAWNWKAAILKDLLDSQPTIFLCGSADNSEEFFNLFDKVFVLTISPEIQRQRIISRTAHGYGKSPEMQAIVLQEQREFVDRALQLGAIPLDANPATVKVADSLLEMMTQ
jgi:dephospho-CoA kinase